MELTDVTVILVLLVLVVRLALLESEVRKVSEALKANEDLLDQLDRKVNEAQREKSRRNG